MIKIKYHEHLYHRVIPDIFGEPVTYTGILLTPDQLLTYDSDIENFIVSALSYSRRGNEATANGGWWGVDIDNPILPDSKLTPGKIYVDITDHKRGHGFPTSDGQIYSDPESYGVALSSCVIAQPGWCGGVEITDIDDSLDYRFYPVRHILTPSGNS